MRHESEEAIPLVCHSSARLADDPRYNRLEARLPLPMKKQKPIILDRDEIRKSVRKPMPRPAQRHQDKRDKLRGKVRESEVPTPIRTDKLRADLVPPDHHHRQIVGGVCAAEKRGELARDTRSRSSPAPLSRQAGSILISRSSPYSSPLLLRASVRPSE